MKSLLTTNPGSSDADNEEEEECTTIQQWDDWFGEESETDED